MYERLLKSVCCQELLPPLRGVGSVAQEVEIKPPDEYPQSTGEGLVFQVILNLGTDLNY